MGDVAEPLWTLPEPFDSGIDAAACSYESKRQLVLFRNGQFMNYSAAKMETGHRVLSAPCPTKDSPVWGELPPPFDTKIDEALCVDSARQIYILFSEGLVMEYSSAKGPPPPTPCGQQGTRILRKPCTTRDDEIWGELPPPFDTQIDSAVCVMQTKRTLGLEPRALASMRHLGRLGLRPAAAALLLPHRRGGMRLGGAPRELALQRGAVDAVPGHPRHAGRAEAVRDAGGALNRLAARL
jgi:hypothetical protein